MAERDTGAHIKLDDVRRLLAEVMRQQRGDTVTIGRRLAASLAWTVGAFVAESDRWRERDDG